jgi:hypothetical protein
LIVDYQHRTDGNASFRQTLAGFGDCSGEKGIHDKNSRGGMFSLSFQRSVNSLISLGLEEELAIRKYSRRAPAGTAGASPAKSFVARYAPRVPLVGSICLFSKAQSNRLQSSFSPPAREPLHGSPKKLTLAPNKTPAARIYPQNNQGDPGRSSR